MQELEEAVRERGKELKDAKTRREDLGVELYGVQQQLAKLQMTLEKAHEEYGEINRVRLQVGRHKARGIKRSDSHHWHYLTDSLPHSLMSKLSLNVFVSSVWHGLPLAMLPGRDDRRDTQWPPLTPCLRCLS